MIQRISPNCISLFLLSEFLLINLITLILTVPEDVGFHTEMKLWLGSDCAENLVDTGFQLKPLISRR